MGKRNETHVQALRPETEKLIEEGKAGWKQQNSMDSRTQTQ